jgi:hypothetical protein
MEAVPSWRRIGLVTLIALALVAVIAIIFVVAS